MNSLWSAMAKRVRSQLPCLAVLAALITGQHAPAQTPAFPGALGFGQYATGGRGGTVYHVTTLADSGTGSFRDAVSHSGRMVVFDVGGYVTLASPVSCANNLTIAGQTAPGGGIGIMGHEVSFSARFNEIVRHVRFRPDSTADGEDGINVGDGTNMIFDHISIEFGPYNNIDAHGDHGSDAITVQNSIIADPSFNGSSHKQGFGAHTEHLGGVMSWYYNVWVSEHNRQPLAKIDTIFVNNTEYNFQAGYTVADTEGHFRHDIINNYFITGPTDPAGGDAFFQMNANQTIYSTNNLRDNNTDGALNGSSIEPGGGGTVLSAPWSPLSTNVTVFSTAGAYHYDVSWAGAIPRDQVDSLVLSQVRTLGSGSAGGGAGTTGPSGLYNNQTQTGLANNGYGVINGGIAPIDTDGDGMPDYWEKAMGLNPNSSSDTMTISGDGYANIEHYLNWLADPHAVTGTNTPVDIDLWQFTLGFTNFAAVYTVVNGSNGVVTLNNSHVAHFVPTANFAGLGSFQFTVAASDGSGYTNNLHVLMTPITTPANLVWQGDGLANVWTNGGPANWNDGTNLVPFASGDNVTFDDTGSNTPAITLASPVSAGTVYVLADDQDYVFGGTGFLSGGTMLFKTGNGQLTLNTTNTYSGGTTINDGVVQIGDGVSFNGGLAGPVVNNDTLIYATPGNLSSSASISGPGTLTKNGPGTVTLSGTETYTGVTTVNAGGLTISGTLPQSDITNNGALTFVPTGSQVYTNSLSGPGTVTLAGGTLTLSTPNTYTGNTTNRAGVLYIANSNAIGSGVMVYTNGNVWLTGGVTITNDFSISGASAIDLCLAATNGVCTWAGNVVNLQSAAQWRPGADTGGTLIFLGNAVMGTRNFIVPRGSVQFAANAVVSATGSATAFGRDTSGGNRSASVTIKDNAAITLGVCSFGGGQAGGGVTLTLQNNAVLSCGANNFDIQNVNRATAVTTLRLNGGTMTVGGFTKTKTVQTNVINFNGGLLKAGAFNAAFLPTFSFGTNLVQAGGAVIDDGGFSIAIAGQMIHDPGLGANLDGGLTKLGTGTLTLAANDTYTGPTVIKAGTLMLYAPPIGAITNSASVSIAAGALLDFSLGGTGSMALGGGKIISGNGAVKGNFTLGSAAILSPGSNAIGALTFSNALTLAAGCTNLFEIRHSPLTNDAIFVTGALTNGGTLVVTNLGGTPFAAGDTFTLFKAGSYTGVFAGVKLPPLPIGLLWNTNSLNTAGTISVVLNTTPAFGSISISGDSVGLSGTGGVGNAYYVLLGATNLSDGNWTPLFTNQFDNSGNFNFTTNADTSAPQNFYRLQLQ